MIRINRDISDIFRNLKDIAVGVSTRWLREALISLPDILQADNYIFQLQIILVS